MRVRPLWDRESSGPIPSYFVVNRNWTEHPTRQTSWVNLSKGFSAGVSRSPVARKAPRRSCEVRPASSLSPALLLRP
jgi:hypothetical protein